MLMMLNSRETVSRLGLEASDEQSASRSLSRFASRKAAPRVVEGIQVSHNATINVEDGGEPFQLSDLQRKKTKVSRLLHAKRLASELSAELTCMPSGHLWERSYVFEIGIDEGGRERKAFVPLICSGGDVGSSSAGEQDFVKCHTCQYPVNTVAILQSAGSYHRRSSRLINIDQC
jgi:hypothetical protein